MNRLVIVFILMPLLGSPQEVPINKNFAIRLAGFQASVFMTSISGTTIGGKVLNGEGIKWIEGLSWEQVKKRAKQENKYIFLDCFTTWCGPCKMMDKNVYSNDTVSRYFNQYFISVKVQMDKTKYDNYYIQSWYKDAEDINKKYRVEGYPTFIFISPQGKIVQKSMGYVDVRNLINIAITATKSDQEYRDPYAAYDSLVAEYNRGVKHYNRMPYMIRTAYKFGEYDFGRILLDEHTNYLTGLQSDQRYTRENIQLWSSFLLRSDGLRFQFFYKDGFLIDKVMRQKGYAQSILVRTIQNEIVDSFYRMQEGETILITGKRVKNSEIMFMGQLPARMDGKIEQDFVEADWKLLERMLKKKYNKELVNRTMLIAKIQWYKQHNNMYAFVNNSLLQYKKYPFDPDKDATDINSIAWTTFLYITDKKMLKGSISLAENVLKRHPKFIQLIDTYANLLYKVGRSEDAIHWEERACELQPLDIEMKEALEKMKKGERTYLKQGAIWE